MIRRGSAPVLALCAVLAIGIGACGDDDFANEPRIPSPIEITAKITDRKIEVAPAKFGAGLVIVAISNQTDEATRLVLDGPTSAESGLIPAGSALTLKVNFVEGVYDVTASETSLRSRPGRIDVGEPRKTAQNELLTP